MLLVRYINNKEPEIILNGVESEIITKIKELNLVDWHDVYFYERDHFENLGLGNKIYDYYSICDKIK